MRSMMISMAGVIGHCPITTASCRGHKRTRCTGTKASGSDSADAESEDPMYAWRQVPHESAEKSRQGWRPRFGSSVSGGGKWKL